MSIAFHASLDLSRCGCSAFGILGDKGCDRSPVRLVILNGYWFGAACCGDEEHAALTVQWTREQFGRYGYNGAARLDELADRRLVQRQLPQPLIGEVTRAGR